MISDVAIANGEVSSSIPKGSVNYLYKANGSLTRLIRTDILPNSSSELLVLDASLSYNENRELTGLTEKIKTGGGVRETEYTYAYDHDGRPVSVEYGDLSQTKSYDGYGRLTSETVSENNTQAVSRSYTYKDLSTTRTTPQVQSLASAFGNGSITHSYTYDQNGRILSDITANTSSVYEYDSLGQLVWEKSASKGKAWQYTYDLGGNILSKTEYDYANGTVGNQTSQKLYAYGDSEWHDLLTSYNGDPITYDTIGNPLSYRGWTMDWQAGRQLRSMSKNSTSLSFEYDESGLRTKKTVGTDETRYVWNGGKLAAQLGPSASFFFHYDASGEMISYTYVPASGTEKEYFLIKNLQGDVERVVTSTGSIVAQYNYDAWGNVVYSAGTFKNTNPIRYRGYYFDTESGLYYLKNRYYDPQVGRFINADALVDAGRGSIGLNPFAYCLNDPVNSIDNTGFYTLSFGGEGAAANDYRVAFGEQIIIDSTGQYGLLDYGSVGIGTPSASFSGTVTLTTAKSMEDLSGPGESIGFSILNVTIEYISGKDWRGITVSVSPQPSLEIHTEYTKTKITNLKRNDSYKRDLNRNY